jgi:CRISPR/Cas system CSM-associated protein Csm4 (group 5 of RAMP superfamily)
LVLKEKKKKEEEEKKKKEDEKKKKEDEEKKENEKKNKLEIKKKNLCEEPPIDEKNICLIHFRLPNGETIKRRFKETDKIENIYDWLHVCHNFDPELYYLIIGNKKYENSQKKLKELGLEKNIKFFVREILK